MIDMYESYYKCRNCGRVFSTAIANKDVMMRHLVLLTCEESSYEPSTGDANGLLRHTIHCCNDNEFGFADFIGIRKVEDNEK